MKLLLYLVSVVIISLSSFASKTDNRYFELRICYCHPGKLDALMEANGKIVEKVEFLMLKPLSFSKIK